MTDIRYCKVTRPVEVNHKWELLGAQDTCYVEQCSECGVIRTWVSYALKGEPEITNTLVKETEK